MTVILAGHDTEELFPLVDRVAFMDGGRIVSVLPPREFVKAADHAALPFLPTVPRVWRLSDGNGEAPLSVREGRAWLASLVGTDAATEPENVPTETGSDAPLLSAKDVWFRYGRNEPDVVADLTCTLSPGEILAVLGPNGTGKTTLIKLLAGILRPVAGTVRFEGKKDLPKAGRGGVAYLPQNPALLFAHDTVREELDEMTPGLADKEDKIADVVSRLSLGDLLPTISAEGNRPGWRSPNCSCSPRASCSSTSRRRGWTRSPAGNSARSSGNSRLRGAPF